MSKTYETKKRIISLLKERARTPTEISAELGLSPSTISQHLKELEDNGTIEGYPDEHFHNTKHYAMAAGRGRPMLSPNAIRIGAAAVAIVAIALIAAFLYTQQAVAATAAQGTSSSVGILLTDPPQVPSGTQALTVTYSSLKVQMTNTSGTFWDSVNSSGTVNLLSLINFTEVMSNFTLPANTMVDIVSFNLTNASITINGTTYPVLVPNGHVSARVIYTSTVSPGQFDVLLDMFSTVSAVVTGNQTTFVMSPSAAAATVQRSGSRYNYSYNSTNPHHIARIDTQDLLAIIKCRARISITNASISTSDNQTGISLTVSDGSNKSTELYSVIVLGNESYLFNLNFSGRGYWGPGQGSGWNSSSRQHYGVPSRNAPVNMPPAFYGYIRYAVAAGISGGASASSSGNYINASANYGIGINGGPGQPMPHQGPPIFISRVMLNGSQISALSGNLAQAAVIANLGGIIRARWNGSSNFTLPNLTNMTRFGHVVVQVNYARYMIARLGQFRSLNLLVEQNGTLEVPQRGADFMNKDIGYELGAGDNVSLRYSGPVALGYGRLQIHLKPGEKYRIIVIGSNGAFASANVTAT